MRASWEKWPAVVCRDFSVFVPWHITWSYRVHKCWACALCTSNVINGWFLGVADQQMTSPVACHQPLQILISANECKISVGLSVPTNSLTTFDLHNWHEPTNRQPTNFVGLSVPTNSLTNSDLIKQGFNWHEPTNNWQILSVCQYRQIPWQILT